MRIGLLATWLLVTLVGCDPDGRPAMVTPDAPGPLEARCDDPAVWTSPALAAAELEVVIGGDPCERAQLPLHRVLLTWAGERPVEVEEDQQVGRVCWRVTEASPGSGWTAGQEFSSVGSAEMNLVGFSRPVTVEGRALLEDGRIAYAIAPKKVELAAAAIVEPAASTVIAVMGARGRVERDAVHLWGQRIPTDEVLDAASLRTFAGEDMGDAITLHRVGANVVRRVWTRRDNQIDYTDLVIGPGTRGRITKWGNAVLVDGTDLVILNYDNASHGMVVKRRVTLAAEPTEFLEDGSSVWMHVPGMIIRAGLFEDDLHTLAVGDGVIVPTIEYFASYFFDGTTFRAIQQPYPEIELAPVGIEPKAEDLARIGKPIATIEGIVFGESGFLSIDGLQSGWPAPFGPSSASYADVFGDGRLGPLSIDNATYVIERDGGSAELYQAPYYGYCEPI
ncbi:MAG: hypothetical protein HOV81_45220 [Kofleriaceae bacterium]|nr:hypothetical protein [Kofleriaceae bacterium]